MALDLTDFPGAGGIEGPLFEKVMVESVDEALDEMFGSHEAQAVRHYVKSELAAENLLEYSAKLREVFGGGSAFILRSIELKLKSKVARIAGAPDECSPVVRSGRRRSAS